jgi:2-haloacid dehalogenase
MSGCVIFDLGGVLIDWNPRHLYRKLFDDEAEMEGFLAEVCTQAWNERQDEGRPVAVAVAELTARHPEKRRLIEAYYARWPDMMAGPIEGSPAILEELRGRGVPLYLLSNFSAETFPHAQRKFEFLDWFDGMLISGDVGVKKPDPAIFHILFERCRIDPRHSVYVDDVPGNVAAGRALGLEALHFTSAAALRRDLAQLGLL